MKLSKRSEYGLRAMLDLAAEPGRTAIPLHVLATRNHIPVKFLESIFNSLRNAGIVQSARGPGGGYCLGRQASQITFGEIIRILDGTLAPVSCVSQIAYEPCSCPDESSCSLRVVMSDVRSAILAVVDRTTLEDSIRRMKPIG
ncbi:MAG: Rrf2 family transcriptional regulator [Anaerolineales bacterium]|nr:MAG: Rrf2 family transcriptional regulator [Anaerolineales bacterium]